MRAFIRSINCLLMVAIGLGSVLCAPAYCASAIVAPLSSQAPVDRGCCSSAGATETSEQPDGSDESGGCASCPFMSGLIDHQGAPLSIASFKGTDCSPLPEWCVEWGDRGTFAAQAAPSSGWPSQRTHWARRPNERRALLCVYLI